VSAQHTATSALSVRSAFPSAVLKTEVTGSPFSLPLLYNSGFFTASAGAAMSRVLIVKLSSMGDLIQALPALTDATLAMPEVRFDWVVDEAFAEVPSWHPAVETVIVSAHRRWRRQLFQSMRQGEWRQFFQQLRTRQYDYVLDAQTSLKSALVTRLARGLRVGPDKDSVREYGAHWAYQQRVSVGQQQLAVNRWRELFSAALNYPLPTTAPDFGLSAKEWLQSAHRPAGSYLVMVTNASWPTKCLPPETWRALLSRAQAEGLEVLLPWGSEAERQQALTIADGFSSAHVLPKLGLSEWAGLLAGSAGALCHDTGLAHIAAALGVPTLTVYGPTDPALIGATGPRVAHWRVSDFSCAPCYRRECRYQNYRGPQAQCLAAIAAEDLWQALTKLRQEMLQPLPEQQI